MYDVVFKSDLIGLLIWILLFAMSTIELALVIRSAYLLRIRHLLLKVDPLRIWKRNLCYEDFDITSDVS